MPEWFIIGCEVAGTLGFVFMLMPQIALNASKRSTEGLSTGLVGIWHLSAIFMAAFYATQPDSACALWSMIIFSVASAVIEGQIVAFRPALAEKSSWTRSVVLVGISMFFIAISAAATVLITWILLQVSADAANVIGNYVPCSFLALGFLPQYQEFISTWSIEGYSFGVTFFDVMGSAGNAVVILAGLGSTPSQTLTEAAPFFLLIAMHVVLLCIAAVIVCSRPRERTSSSLLLPSFVDDTSTERVLRSLSRGSSQGFVEKDHYNRVA